MATRSAIGIVTADKEIKAIYCHWDGYPEYNGGVLCEHYRSEEKIYELLALGDISSLEETTEKTVAYHRDRGEEKNEARSFGCKDDYISYFYNSLCEYFCLYDNGEWQVFDDEKDAFIPVKEVLKRLGVQYED